MDNGSPLERFVVTSTDSMLNLYSDLFNFYKEFLDAHAEFNMLIQKEQGFTSDEIKNNDYWHFLRKYMKTYINLMYSYILAKKAMDFSIISAIPNAYKVISDCFSNQLEDEDRYKLMNLVIYPAVITTKFISPLDDQLVHSGAFKFLGEYPHNIQLQTKFILILYKIYDYFLLRYTEFNRENIQDSLMLKNGLRFLVNRQKYINLYISKFIKWKSSNYGQLEALSSVMANINRYNLISQRIRENLVAHYMNEIYNYPNNRTLNTTLDTSLFFVGQLVDYLLIRTFLSLAVINSLVIVAKKHPDTIVYEVQGIESHEREFARFLLQMFLMSNNILNKIIGNGNLDYMGDVIKKIRRELRGGRYRSLLDDLLKDVTENYPSSFDECIQRVKDRMNKRFENVDDDIVFTISLILVLYGFYVKIFNDLKYEPLDSLISTNDSNINNVKEELWLGRANSDIVSLINELIYEAIIFNLGFIPSFTIDKLIKIRIKPFIDDKTEKTLSVDFDYVMIPLNKGASESLIIAELKSFIEEKKILSTLIKFLRKVLLFKVYIENDFIENLGYRGDVTYAMITPSSTLKGIIRYSGRAVESFNRQYSSVLSNILESELYIPINLMSPSMTKRCKLEVGMNNFGLHCEA